MLVYKCPKCSFPLLVRVESKTYRCENNHCFDMAKEGYVNLHLVEKKKSKQPGDDVEMIKSRQQFLSSGLYECLAESIQKNINQLNIAKNIIDIGCGEGYYSNYLAEHLNKTANINFCGIDLSKAGVRLAAKRRFGAQLAVASAFDIPYFDDSFDLAISIFSPLGADEVIRVLKPNAHLIMVGPGPEHLQGLVKAIYQTPAPHKGNFGAVTGHNSLMLLQSERVDKNIEVVQALIPHLLRMTPYYWQATEAQQKALAEMSSLTTPVQFDVNLYQCTKSGSL